MSDNVQSKQPNLGQSESAPDVANEESVNEDVPTNEAADHEASTSEAGWVDERAQLTAQLEEAMAEQERYASMYSRLRADFDNFRRRKIQEMDTVRSTATADVVQGLLPIVDNLERAVTSADESEGALAEGVRLVLRQFIQSLAACGVEPILSVGQPFDPEFHEAVERVESTTEVQSGTVVDELQKGYRMGDIVLRPSVVRVAG